MSLQGTLDTFPLPDVLRLLAATRKSGLLRVEAARGTGRVWITDGELSAAAPPSRGEAAPAAPSAEVLFELLRSRDGSFAFDAGAASPLDGGATALEPLLVEAGTLVEEWSAIEAVVPSLGSTISLRTALDGPEVTITAAQWHLLVAVGGGSTVGRLGAAEGLGELAVSRTVKDLVEAGLVTVGAPAAEPVEEPVEPVEDAEPVEDTEPAEDDEPVAEAAPAPAEVPGTVSVGGFTRRPLGARPAGALPAGPSSLRSSLAELSSAAPTPADEQAEVARTLAELGPEAEAAVAAAAGAATPEERDAALDAITTGPDGEPVNRGALLKFLSSVRS